MLVETRVNFDTIFFFFFEEKKEKDSTNKIS